MKKSKTNWNDPVTYRRLVAVILTEIVGFITGTIVIRYGHDIYWFFDGLIDKIKSKFGME